MGERKQKEIYKAMMETAKARTLQADVELDEDGNPIDPDKSPPSAGRLKGDQNVVIVESSEPLGYVAPTPVDSAKKQPKLFESDAA